MADEYISREALQQCRFTQDEHGEWILAADILAIPAADVVPVRHGEWARIDYKPCGHDYVCSICGDKNDRASNYCPNCGARMDGDGE